MKRSFAIKVAGRSVVQMRETDYADDDEILFLGELPLIPEGMTRCSLVFDGEKLSWEADEPEPQAPTHAEIEAARAAAYRQSVDPITCEILRLRDMGGTEEEIAEAEARRAEAVAAIKAQWPYPEEAL